jgi:hypothetical protein
VKESWCAPHYKTPARLIKWLLRVHGYPDRLVDTGIITKVGFDILMENKLRAERTWDQAWVAKARSTKRAELELARTNLLELLRKRSSP